MTQDADYALPKQRPIGVWVITIYFLISLTCTLSSTLLILSGSAPLTDAQETYFSSMSTILIFMSIIVGSLNLAGVIMLLKYSRWAFYLFLVGMVLNVASVTWERIQINWFESGGSVLGTFIGFGILVVICIYTWSLVKNGTLE